MKVCPSCKKINEDEAASCLGCGADVSQAAKRAGGPNISMFGSSPRQSGAKPLSANRAPASASSRYGSGEAARYVSAAEAAQEKKPKGISIKSGKAQPKKPWEK